MPLWWAAWNWGVFGGLYNVRSLQRGCLFIAYHCFWTLFLCGKQCKEFCNNHLVVGRSWLVQNRHVLTHTVFTIQKLWSRSLSLHGIGLFCRQRVLLLSTDGIVLQAHKSITHSVNTFPVAATYVSSHIWACFSLSFLWHDAREYRCTSSERRSVEELSHEPTWESLGVTCRAAVLNKEL